MLDVSIRISIMDLMLNLAEQYNVSYLYITHDLAVARYMCDRIAVMYLGKIVEITDTERLLAEPLHPYTRGAPGIGACAGPRLRARGSRDQGRYSPRPSIRSRSAGSSSGVPSRQTSAARVIIHLWRTRAMVTSWLAIWWTRE